MKKLLFILFFIPLIASGTDYYVSTTGDDVTGDGSIGTPWKSWQMGFNSIMKGDVLYIRGGTYTDYLGIYGSSYYGVRISGSSIHDGTASEPITVMNYPGEEPILDGTLMTQHGGHFGINLEGCDYWYLKGLIVANFTEFFSDHYHYAGGISGEATHTTLDQCVVHDCGNGFTFNASSDYVYYLNCDSYQNYDHIDGGGYANGFNGNIYIGNHLSFEGCRAWTNSDDGFDMYESAGTYNRGGYITINNCWSWDNGQMGGEIGDGAGFKLGDAWELMKESGVQRIITNCLSFNNHGVGIDESMDAANDGTIVDINVYNNTCYNNGRNFNFGLRAIHSGIVNLTNNISYHYNNPLYLYADNIRAEAHLIQTTNSWQVAIMSNADFLTVNSAGVDGARQANGDLPDLDFLKPANGSDIIDAGTDVGISFSGDAPDLGAYEFGSITSYIPTVTTTVITDITTTTATGGGNVTNDGGEFVSERGICWSTSPNPTTSNHHESAGTGEGIFIAYLTGLESGLTYYVRAYAVNAKGISYGSNVIFTASATPPVMGPTHFVTNGAGGIHYKVKSNGKFVKSK